jgi:hypothetical protein
VSKVTCIFSAIEVSSSFLVGANCADLTNAIFGGARAAKHRILSGIVLPHTNCLIFFDLKYSLSGPLACVTRMELYKETNITDVFFLPTAIS